MSTFFSVSCWCNFTISVSPERARSLRFTLPFFLPTVYSAINPPNSHLEEEKGRNESEEPVGPKSDPEILLHIASHQP